MSMLSILQERIEQEPSKAITYAEYLEIALYHPKYGYYMKEKQKIGREGDFITTSNVSDIFGRVVARWFSLQVAKHQLPPVFCEVGGGNGRFARAFLEEWKEKVKKPLRYILVEESPYHRKLQHELLFPEFDVIQAENLSELAPFEGVLFSNELFDALPVHVIEKEGGVIHEVMIGLKDGKLFEQKKPLVNREISEFLTASQIELQENQRMEIPISTVTMMEKMARTLTKGLVVTVDYGYSKEEWMHPARRKGSLRGYYRHKMVEDVLLHPGEMDITSHIHFDWLMKVGSELNLHFLTKLRQDEFLLKAGVLDELENHQDSNPFSEISKRNRAIRSLIMSSGMSSFFHVLIQQVNLSIEEHHLFD